VPRRIYLLVCAVGVIVTGLVAYGFHAGYRMNTIYAPLIDAAMEIKLGATSAHLWLEEVQSGDSNADFDSVWIHLEEAVWYLKAMLAGGENFQGTILNPADPELLAQIKDMHQILAKLEAFTLERLTSADTNSPHSELDQDLDQLFKNFIDLVDQVQAKLQRLMASSLRYFHLTQSILVFACILLIFIIGISFQRFERQRAENFLILKNTNDSLEKEIVERKKAEEAVRRAHDGLEQKVRERTFKLAQTNHQLKREIQERIRAEQELLSYQAKLRALSSELSLTEERERRRIAVDLHDRIGQNLSAISLSKLTELGELKSSEELAQALLDMRELIKEMIEDTRVLMADLSPPVLYDLGLEAAIEGMVDSIQNQHRITIAFHDDKQPKPLSEGARAFIFQAVRELLSNIAQHARAATAEISIRREGQNLVVDISDDYVGFDAGEINSDIVKPYGFGIFIIRERLRYFGGTLEITSEPDRGTRAVLMFPLQTDETPRQA
jgi:signal transduction histidine kinase